MDERYKQHAGLKYNERAIEELAEMRSVNARTFLGSFSHPRELFLSSVENIADSSTKKLELKLYNLRNKKIVSPRHRYGRTPVIWSTWRQFNNAQKDGAKRKQVFDEFISKTRYISPIIKQRFDQIGDAYGEYWGKKIGPLDGYLENEKISYSQLINFVKSMGRQAKKPFQETLSTISRKVLGREAEYWNRYSFSMGIAEIFSIFLERLTKNRKYLSLLGICNERILEEIDMRNKFMDLFFVTFYTANSLMKAEFWRKKLSIEEASDLYAALIREYTGLEIPGDYWLLHHILPDAIMYVPSYLLAAVRAAELERHLKERFGEDWWIHADTGSYIREIMQPGAEIDISRFSRLDSSLFMKEITS